jgi:hypothetical protein
MINRRRFLIGSSAAALTVGNVTAPPPTPTWVECVFINDVDIENSDVIRALFHRFQRENRVIRSECSMAWIITPPRAIS